MAGLRIEISPADATPAHIARVISSGGTSITDTGTGIVYQTAPGVSVAPGWTITDGLFSGGLVFPAVTEDFQVDDTITFGDYDSVGAGSFSVRRGGPDDARELRSLTVNVFASNADHAFLQAGSPSTWGDLYDKIKRIAYARFPIHLRAHLVSDGGIPLGPDPDLSMDVTIRSFNKRLPTGQPGDRYFMVEFKEYRDQEDGEETVRYARVRGARLPYNYPMRPGDQVTLGELASRYYGSYSLWSIIRDANDGLRRKNAVASRPISEYGVSSVSIPRPPASINDRRAAV